MKKHRTLQHILSFILLAGPLALNVLAAGGELDTTFTTGVAAFGSTANAVAVQPDGRVLVGGNFTVVNGRAIPYFARLNADGTTDRSFNAGAGPNFVIDAITVQPDGRILIGGQFSAYNGVTINRLARLNADGSLDTTFNPGGDGLGGTVNAITLQTDGRILIGGFFSSYNGTTISSFMRLNSNGTLDTAFNANLGSGFGFGGVGPTVRAVVVQSNGQILAGGSFTDLNGGAANFLVRLNSDGTRDNAFTTNGGTGFDRAVNTLAVQADGRIIAGGAFTNFNGTAASGMARLNVTGTHDTSFTSPVSNGSGGGQPFALLIQPNGQILAAGETVAFGPAFEHPHIARINQTDGSLDVSFNAGTGADSGFGPNSIALQPDGTIFAAGRFNTFNGVIRPNLIKLNANGSVNTGFAPAVGIPAHVFDVVIQPDNKILIGGDFTSVNEFIRLGVARLNADGTTDTTFNPNLGTLAQGGLGAFTVTAIAVQTDGKILVGGNFVSFGGGASNSGLARLNADGSLDGTFNASVGGGVSSIALQTDGKIVIGGNFNGVNGTTGTYHIARLNANGTTDGTFSSGTGFTVFSGVEDVVYLASGQILVGGSFTEYNGATGVNRIARLNANGTLDTGFTSNTGTGFDNGVNALAVQTDGKIIAGGFFYNFNGVSNGLIARLNANGTLDNAFTDGTGFGEVSGGVQIYDLALQADGKVLVVGSLRSYNGVPRMDLARLNTDGSLDASFNSGVPVFSRLQAVALDNDNQILIGGDLLSYSDIPRIGLARLLNNGAGAMRFSSAGFVATENSANAVITVNRSANEGAVSVNYATSNGTATAGSDYTATSGTLNFLDGEIAKTFIIPLLNDNLVEGVESVNLTLSAPTGGATLGTPSNAILTIVDDDSFTISGRVTDSNGVPLAAIPLAVSGAVTRGTRTDANGNYAFPALPAGLTYTVTLPNPYYVFAPSRADFPNLTVDRTQNFAALPNAVPSAAPPLIDSFPPRPNPDPTLWNLGLLSFPPGSFDPNVTVSQQTGQLVITPVANQAGNHFNGYVSVNNYDLSNGQVAVELVQAGTGGTQSIFSIGTDFQNFARFLVQSPTGNQPLYIEEVRNGQRQPAFLATTTMLTFQFVQNGQTFLSVSLEYDPVAHRYLRFRHFIANAANDILFETSPDASAWTERARASLGERSVTGLTVELAGGTAGSASNPGPIVFDNLTMQVLNARFTTPVVSVNEGDGQVTLTVTRTGLTNLASSVEYATTDGTASQRSRYTAAAGVLRFAAGETSKTLQILLVDELLDNGTQTFNVFLGPGVGMGVNGPGRTIVTINDNDAPPITSNPLETTQFFVTEQYYDFLSRAPDAGGLAFWMNEITGPCNGNPACISQRRWQVSLAFFVELEFQQTGAYVYRLYRAAYGNTQPFPNPSGDNDANPYCVQVGCPFRAAHIPSYQRFVTDRARVVGSANLSADQLALANMFVNRAEFRQRYPTTQTGTQFVDALLANLQTASGVNLTSQRDALITLHNTGGRGAVLYHLADDNVQTNPINNRAFIDAEYNRGFVLTQYFGYLRRDPDQPGLNFWRDVVNQFPLRSPAGQNGMVCAFITSQEYQERFSLVSPRTNQECPPIGAASTRGDSK